MKAHTSARAYFPGMGTAVADRTINRVIEDKDGSTRLETWEDVSHRVALGNSLLDPRGSTADEKMDFRTAEYNTMNHHLRQASLLMSGRHLQHGDATQPFRPMEVFTNCLGFDNKINTLEFGSIEIGKIVGETVHVQASDGEWRLASVNEYGTQKLFKIEFGNKNGGSIRHVVTATANHRWLLADGTVTEDLKIGDNLKAISSKFETDSQAIVHGIIFGDGTGHKSRSDTYRTGVSYGRTYASIRVCKQDTTKDEIHRIFDEAGYRYTQPSHANGDRVYYLGKYPFAKELPTTVDPGYIDGFIRGWWMADGYKKYDYSDAIIISTINEDAVNWLKDYASYAGYSIVSLRRQDRKEGDGSYANGKPLYTIRLRKDVNWMVRSIEQIGDHKVYCVEEPVTKSFTLSNGLLTGNCSTSVTTFLMFYLLLNGSGVGRAYDDDLIMVDFTKSPLIVPVIDSDHADVRSGEIQHFLTPREARHKYAHKPEDKVIYFKVPDSREGWAKAIEVIETNTFLGKHDSVLMLDFSEVRPRNTPIAGMQNRPASGPGPLMGAISKIAGLRDSDMAPWMAAMFADHYMAECVLVGGARRAARMATKYWRDRTIFDFINLKRGGFLWSSNNSVTIDEEFRKACKRVRDILANSDRSVEDLQHDGVISAIEGHAWRVLEALARASYFDGTGEPGIINQDKLVENNEGISEYLNGEFANGSRFSVDAETIPLMQNLAAKVYDKRYTMITNPCVPGDTWVETSEGPRLVRDLIDKPFKAVVNGKSYQATGFWKTGVKPVFRITTDRGYELRATDNHKILVERNRRRKLNGDYNIDYEWVEVKDLQHGDILVLNDHRERNPGGIDSNEMEQGWLLGLMVGDGGFNPDLYRGYVRFWGLDAKSECEYARSIIRELPHEWHRPVEIGESSVENAQNHSYQVSSRALDELAMRYIEPKTKRILPALEMADTSIVVGFLRGFFDADGTVIGDLEKGRSVRLAQSDLGRLKVVQRMLLRLGVASTIYENRRPKGLRMLPDGNGDMAEYECQAQHELVISKSNMREFFCNVGFRHAEKHAKLHSFFKPSSRELYQERFSARVETIEADGVEPVYDCTVDDVHRFDANGIIAHNCGEITLLMLGAYCVIADVVPFHATDDDDAESAFRTAVRALIRTNLMDSIYHKEVKRTNRIGVGITGFHEWVYARFGFNWYDIIDENKSKEMWMTLSRFKRAIIQEASSYSKELGVVVPHTNTTFKPAGCASLDTAIKTTDGVLTMRELFSKHGITEDDLHGMESGTWIEPKIKTMVLDEGNVEREVTKLYLNGIKPVYEIEFEDGVVAKLTGNHKLKLLSGEWKRVDELTELDEILEY